MEEERSWINEVVKAVPKRNWLYKFMCFWLFRKLTYKEMYAIIDSLNRKAMGERESKKHAMKEILSIYQFNNNCLPDFSNNKLPD